MSSQSERQVHDKRDGWVPLAVPLRFKAKPGAQALAIVICIGVSVWTCVASWSALDTSNWQAPLLPIVLGGIALLAARETWLLDVTLEEQRITYRTLLGTRAYSYSEVSRLELRFRKATIHFKDGARAVVTPLMGDLATVGDAIVPRIDSHVPIDMQLKR